MTMRCRTVNPMPGRCEEWLSRISLYLDGELAEHLCRELERHLAECPDCHVVFHTTRRTIELYRRYGRTPMPAEARERLFRVLRLEDLLPGPTRPPKAPRKQDSAVEPAYRSPTQRDADETPCHP